MITAGTTIVALGLAVGVTAGNLDDPGSATFGSPPPPISVAERIDDIAPLPQGPSIPPLETTAPERTEEPEPEYAGEEPDYEYQPPVEEKKETYVPAPTSEPAPSSSPDVTVGKNE